MINLQQKGKVRFVDPEKRFFFNTLKQRVDQYFKDRQISSHANATMIIKSIALMTLYLGPIAIIFIFQPPLLLALPLWMIAGMGMAGVGMSVMHDANHGAYSASPVVNNLMAHTLNLLGGAMHNWRLQHNVLHHTYTNITYMDDDIEDKGILRFSPHTPVKPVHRFQWWYAFAFYGITTLYWVTAKDFVQYIKYTRNGVNQKSKAENRLILLRIIGLKIAYFSVVLVLPLLLGMSFGAVLVGFLAMHFTSGIILTVVFQLAHTVEGTSHPMPNAEGNIENEWAIHQMNTTVNFSPDNKVLSWYFGGLNFQVEHHLFPRVCHVHYPKIAPIVKQTAAEFNVPYLENPTLGQALRSHITALKRFGRMPSLDEVLD